ncbi:MAG: DNA polymerase Y family protein, partial [candidate division FCPU426 bacterium]
RPSRFLPKPLPLARNGDELLQFSAPQRRWRVRSWQGPERISGSWWDEAFDRDYYQVETEQGRRLWLYTTAGSAASTVWLQGYFD